MPVWPIMAGLLAQIKKAQEDKLKAGLEAQPLFDMVGLWNLQGVPGMPETDSEYAAQTEVLIKNWATNKGLPLSLFLPGKSPVTPAEAPAEASSIIDKGLSLITVLNSIGVLAEAASLGQVESVIWAMMNIVNASGLPNVIQDLYRTPVDIGVKIPLERRMYAMYQPKIPDIRALTALRSRGMLQEDAYNWMMQEQGYPDWASEMMAYAETRHPDINTTMDLWRRKIISDEWFKMFIRRAGYHPDVEWALERARFQLPGYQDIISVYMREGYLEEKWVEIPEEFQPFMEQLGFSEFWAKRLWGKHWVLPSVTLLYDMLHKKIITYDTMVKMLKYHDFEPVWRDRLIDNAYNMIPRVDLRRAYRYGMLGAEGLQERYEWLGFKPSDAEIMAGIATRSSLDRYYTRYETVARAAFRKGKLSETDFKSVLERINTPKEAVSIVLESEKLAKEAAVLEPAEEARTLTAAQILSLYRERILAGDIAFKRLAGLGYTSEDANLLLYLSEPKPEPMEINRDLISAASALFREGYLDVEVFEGYLRKAGLSETDVSKKIDAEELRYRLDYAKDLAALAKEAFKKDVYTTKELEGYLLSSGMQHERVKALVALETLRKIPKPKVAA